MSERALLEELLDFLEQFRFGRAANIEPYLKEIRTRMAAAPPICKHEFPKYYCELEMYDGDCSHCTDKLECFQPKEKKDEKPLDVNDHYDWHYGKKDGN